MTKLSPPAWALDKAAPDNSKSADNSLERGIGMAPLYWYLSEGPAEHAFFRDHTSLQLGIAVLIICRLNGRWKTCLAELAAAVRALQTASAICSRVIDKEEPTP